MFVVVVVVTVLERVVSNCEFVVPIHTVVVVEWWWLEVVVDPPYDCCCGCCSGRGHSRPIEIHHIPTNHLCDHDDIPATLSRQGP